MPRLLSRPAACVFSLISGLVLLTITGRAGAIELGQVDDFQGGTTAGWDVGGPNPLPPEVVSDSGPGGSGNHALRLRAQGGNGPGSRLAILNHRQWRGNYPAANVGGLALHIRNNGSSHLQLRLGVEGPGGRFVVENAVPVAAGSGWQTVRFPLQAVDLASSGGSNVNSTLANVSELRLVHNPSLDFRGASIVGEALVDNIIALPAEWLPGDTDLDGDIDAADLTNLTLGWTGARDVDQIAGRTLLEGDADGDLDVDSSDLTEMVLNWTGSAAEPLSVVSEPSAGAVAIVAMGVWLVVSRRRTGVTNG